MQKIRVLIIDDSIVVRHLISEILNEADIELVGTASNGKLGVEKVKSLSPDLVVLDIEMPEMDGLQALQEIRKTNARLPVIMCSTLTHQGAEATIKALSLGATDYVAKPTNTASIANSKESFKQDLLPKIRLHGGKRLGAVTQALSGTPNKQANQQSIVTTKNKIKKRIDIVAIGVSTGGPNALEKVLTTIPANFPVPIVIVQHMPPNFTKMLAEHLNNKCPLTVRECVAGEVLLPGNIWIAAGGNHMALSRDNNQIKLTMNTDPPENSCRPAVDVLFRSVASIFGANSLAVVMTGMGSDGLKGCEVISQQGGQIIAQDEASSVVWGMPGFVAKSGMCDAVVPLDKISEEIMGKVFFGRTATQSQLNTTNKALRSE